MPIEACFDIEEQERLGIIEKEIIPNLPEAEREAARQRVIKIITDYQGRDTEAIGILISAAQEGRFNEFAQKLERNYTESRLELLPPRLRRVTTLHGAMELERFLLACYDALAPPQK